MIYSPSCESTNDLIKECAKTFGLDTPLMLYTFHQKSGRGQRGTHWFSQPGKNLAMTIGLDEAHLKSINPVAMNKCITLAVRKALENMINEEVLVKWPNDLLCNGIKVCGMLMESVVGSNGVKTMYTGIGINVNQTLFPTDFQAGSLKTFGKKEYEIVEVLKEVISNIALYINDINVKKISDEFNTCLWKYNEKVVLVLADGTEVSGQLIGVDAEGKIELQTDAEPHNSWHHGEARLKR